eukprot:TRINITY_DN7249_c0_g1_i2.p1 TRINITY_DN7249_c0_g1~~TRINITY_DN7249_c0_g1_i2.p1  ORF type:complete len:296 (+),score=53.66 TRINITY_DN7249_c0_g1_i2:321-1208(+)
MQKLNCCNNKHVVLSLFDRYDTKDRSVLNVNDLCTGLFGLRNVPKANPVCRNVLKDVTERILSRGGHNGVRTLTRILRRMDDNGNRNLDKIELVEGLAHYGVQLTDDEASIVFTSFDTDNSGGISVKEFLVGIRGKMNGQRTKVVKLAFTRLDKDADRCCTMDDLMKVYNAREHPDVVNGSKTELDVIRIFAADWDRNGDDVITEEEFIDYYKDLSAGIDDDQYFELMLRNAWHLPGGKGAARNTANRRVCVTHIDGTQTIQVLADDLSCGEDIDKIKAQLRKQGVTDILRVHLN